MTATIRPNTSQVSRANVDDRLEDYKRCIRFYLEATDLPIYFLENSNFDLSKEPDFKLFNENPRFHLIRFSPHTDNCRGKGFQEFYMLDQFVEFHLKYDSFIKVTGRYTVRNIQSIIDKLHGPLCIDLHKKMKVAITGLFAIEKETYREFFHQAYMEANDSKGIYIEHVLYAKIKRSLNDLSLSLLPENPQFEGVSGSYGASLKRNKYKMMIRSVERKLNTSLGIREFLLEY